MHDVGPPLGEDSFQFNSICLNGLHSLNLIQHLAGKRNALRFRLDHSTIACYYGISTKLPPPPPPQIFLLNLLEREQVKLKTIFIASKGDVM